MAYSPEPRSAVIARMLAPNSVPLTRLAKEEGKALGTLIRGRDDVRRQGHLLPAADRGPDSWSSRDKFAAVLETAALNETDLAAYCRQRGLLPEQIRAWRTACEEANDWERASTVRMSQTSREERKRIHALERERLRKEKALAEVAALIIPRKKPRRSEDRARTNDQHPRSPARR
jgi:hypothetical protein